MVKLCGLPVQQLNGLLLVWKQIGAGAGAGGGAAKLFLPKSKMKKSANVCVMACVRVCAVYSCVCKQDPEVRRGSGVGGWEGGFLFTQCRGWEYWAG